MTNQEIKLRLIEAYIKDGRISKVYNFDTIIEEIDNLLGYINKDNVINEIEEDKKDFYKIGNFDKNCDDSCKYHCTEGNTKIAECLKSKEEQLKKIYFDFYDQMEEPERSEAKENFNYYRVKTFVLPESIEATISCGFNFESTNQGILYWCNIIKKYEK